MLAFFKKTCYIKSTQMFAWIFLSYIRTTPPLTINTIQEYNTGDFYPFLGGIYDIFTI